MSRLRIGLVAGILLTGAVFPVNVAADGRLFPTVPLPPPREATPYLAVTQVSPAAPAPATFSVTVEARMANGDKRQVEANTPVYLAIAIGSGSLGGTTTGVIPTGNHMVTIRGVTYDRPEMIVRLRATETPLPEETRQAAYRPGDSPTFTVTPHRAIALPEGGYHALILDPSGNPVALYGEQSGGKAAGKLLRCSDPACGSGSTIVAVDIGAQSPEVFALDASGNPIVGFHFEPVPGRPPSPKFLYCGRPDCSADNKTVFLDYVLTGRPLMGVDTAGNPVFVGWENGTDLLTVYRCSDRTCRLDTPTGGGPNYTVATPDRNFKRPPSVGNLQLLLPPNGNPVIAYTHRESTVDSLRIIRCGNPSCTAGNGVSSLPLAGRTGSPAIAVNASGSPVIVYASLTQGAAGLKVLRCADAECALPVVSTVDTGGQHVRDLQAALDGRDRPVVSLRWGGPWGTSLLRCGDPRCFAGNSLEAIGYQEWYVRQVLLDAGGKPSVLMQASHLGTPRLVRCANLDCKVPGMGLPPPAFSVNPGPPAFELFLHWAMPPLAAQYHLQLIPSGDDGPGLDLIASERSPAGTFRVPGPPEWYGLLPDMTYTVRVRATQATEFVGPHDSSWGEWGRATFRTPKVDSDTIGFVHPPAGATLTTRNPVLQWENTRKDVYYYEVQVSKDPAFDTRPETATAMVYWSLVHGGATVPRNSYTVPDTHPLEEGATYYWRVRPRVQGDGTPVSWPPARSFVVAGR